MLSYKLILSTSRRKDGSMRFSSDPDDTVAVKNRSRFFHSLGISASKVVSTKQVHGIGIKEVGKIPSSGFAPGYNDALVTAKPNIFIAIKTADCFPVFFYDTPLHVVAIAHAGWRGVVKGIVPEVIKFLQKRYAVAPGELNAFIGPGIQKCHFQIWPKDRHRGIAPYAKRYKKFVRASESKVFMDLSGIIKEQLMTNGIRSGRIKTSHECTYHMPRRYFSYRRDKGSEHPEGFGNMVSVIGFKPL